MDTNLSPKDIQLIISKAKNPRDHLLMAFLWETGCRISEALAVTPQDVHSDRQVIVIRHPKSGNGNYREVLLTPDLMHAMVTFIRTVKCPRDASVFKIGRRQAYGVIRGAAAAAGFGGKCILLVEHNKAHYVSPHRFRDTISVAKITFNPDAVGQKLLQQQLGHKSFATTAKYIKLGLEAQRQNDDEFWKQLKDKEKSQDGSRAKAASPL